jgi:hypothetical protein
MKSQNPPTHFVIDRGGDNFDVITGYKLNDKPLDLAAANQNCATLKLLGFVGGRQSCDAAHAADLRSGRVQRRL